MTTREYDRDESYYAEVRYDAIFPLRDPDTFLEDVRKTAEGFGGDWSDLPEFTEVLLDAINNASEVIVKTSSGDIQVAPRNTMPLGVWDADNHDAANWNYLQDLEGLTMEHEGHGRVRVTCLTLTDENVLEYLSAALYRLGEFGLIEDCYLNEVNEELEERLEQDTLWEAQALTEARWDDLSDALGDWLNEGNLSCISDCGTHADWEEDPMPYLIARVGAATE